VVVDALPLSGWVLRSAEEVDALEEERAAAGWDDEATAWCVGSAAAERARARGWRSVVEVDGDGPDAVVAAVAERNQRAAFAGARGS
jgi:hypothetical protein